MREILFRGKRLDNGEWVVGDLIASNLISPDRNGELYINGKYTDGMLWGEGCFYRIDQSTIGQCTGLKDKNGKRIFEGDIVAQNWYDYDEPSDDSFGEVVFCEYDCSFSVMDIQKDGIIPLGRCHAYHWEAEVIGNIHDDNPEMLKGGEG